MEHATWPARFLLLLFSAIIVYMVVSAQRGRQLFIRRIPGLSAIDEAVGRATEMGRPILMSNGLGGLDSYPIITLQALAILADVTQTAARFGNRVMLAVRDPALIPVAEEAISGAYNSGGRGDLYNPDDILFLSSEQFAYAAGMAGIIQREKVAALFLFGYFYAESLIMAENANQVGAIQVAGTPSTTQIPFFIAACDYVIIGDEYYAATAYLTREPTLLGSLVAQDICKAILLACILVGVVLMAANQPFLLNLFGDKNLTDFGQYFQVQNAAGG